MNAADVRNEVVAFLKRELIGPDPRPEHLPLNGREEILRPQDPPRLRYSAGVLFPGGSRFEQTEAAEPEEVEAAEAGPPEGDEPEDVTPSGGYLEVDEGTEHEVNRANEFLPSAMGLSALVRLPKQFKITVSAGRYERKAQDGLGKPDKKGQWQPHHWRKAVQPEPLIIECSRLIEPKSVTMEIPVETGTPEMKLAVHLFSRPYAGVQDRSRDRIVTFTLINRTEMAGTSPRDSECFFQCGFRVEDASCEPCFLEYPEREGIENDEEQQSLRLLYRHRKTFAVGHGCAAHWPETEASLVDRIQTDSLPAYEIKPILPREISGLELSMGDLAEVEGQGPIETCSRLAAEYKQWIDQQKKLVEGPSFPSEYRESALRHGQRQLFLSLATIKTFQCGGLKSVFNSRV